MAIIETAASEAIRNRFPGALGFLPLDLGWRGAFMRLVIYGGPFKHFPSADSVAFGVCLREEAPGFCTIHLPIRDFGVPEHREQVMTALRGAFDAALRGKDVYAGCMGGIGRTGLFLSLMAKAAGQEKPVEFVRTHYLSGAVETKEQERYVQTFDVSELRSWLLRTAWTTRFRKLLSRRAHR